MAAISKNEFTSTFDYLSENNINILGVLTRFVRNRNDALQFFKMANEIQYGGHIEKLAKNHPDQMLRRLVYISWGL